MNCVLHVLFFFFLLLFPFRFLLLFSLFCFRCRVSFIFFFLLPPPPPCFFKLLCIDFFLPKKKVSSLDAAVLEPIFVCLVGCFFPPVLRPHLPPSFHFFLLYFTVVVLFLFFFFPSPIHVSFPMSFRHRFRPWFFFVVVVCMLVSSNQKCRTKHKMAGAIVFCLWEIELPLDLLFFFLTFPPPFPFFFIVLFSTSFFPFFFPFSSLMHC